MHYVSDLCDLHIIASRQSRAMFDVVLVTLQDKIE
jgi:hypothetical protein